MFKYIQRARHPKCSNKLINTNIKNVTLIWAKNLTTRNWKFLCSLFWTCLFWLGFHLTRFLTHCTDSKLDLGLKCKDLRLTCDLQNNDLVPLLSYPVVKATITPPAAQCLWMTPGGAKVSARLCARAKFSAARSRVEISVPSPPDRHNALCSWDKRHKMEKIYR